MELSRGSKGFLLVLVVLVLAGVGVLQLLSEPDAGNADTPVTVEIPEGSSADEVAGILEERGVISSALAFRVRARIDDRASRIQPGTYEIVPGTDSSEILAQLSAAPEAAPSFRVTIPEGLTVAETLQRLADAENSPFTVDELTAALPEVTRPQWAPAPEELPPDPPYPGLTSWEGLLFPDTYEFRLDAPAAEVLQRLVDRTEEVLAQVPLGDQQPYDVLTIASLIEREARVREEQPVISSVIANRLAAPMRLQIDASVLYATGKTDANQVLRSDVQVQSPWNTYTSDGLPPTPIAGAGQGAIEAAAHPADTAFLYYVVSNPETGEHAFAETLAEHNRNVAEYRAQRDGG